MADSHGGGGPSHLHRRLLGGGRGGERGIGVDAWGRGRGGPSPYACRCSASPARPPPTGGGGSLQHKTVDGGSLQPRAVHRKVSPVAARFLFG